MSIPEKLHLLEQQLKNYIPALSEAIDQILDSEVTEFPIFVAHQQEVGVGIPTIHRDKVNGDWSINVSSLEEFVAKKLIAESKIEEFKNVYKDPTEFVTIFVLSELGAQFVSMKRELK